MISIRFFWTISISSELSKTKMNEQERKSAQAKLRGSFLRWSAVGRLRHWHERCQCASHHSAQLSGLLFYSLRFWHWMVVDFVTAFTEWHRLELVKRPSNIWLASGDMYRTFRWCILCLADRQSSRNFVKALFKISCLILFQKAIRQNETIAIATFSCPSYSGKLILPVYLKSWLQFTIPFLRCSIPLMFLAFTPLTGIRFGKSINLIGMLISIFPAIDPYLVMFSMPMSGQNLIYHVTPTIFRFSKTIRSWLRVKSGAIRVQTFVSVWIDKEGKLELQWDGVSRL